MATDDARFVVSVTCVLITPVRSAKCGLTDLDDIWGCGKSSGPKMGKHLNANWRIRLNDPCAAACGLTSNYFDTLFDFLSSKCASIY